MNDNSSATQSPAPADPGHKRPILPADAAWLEIAKGVAEILGVAFSVAAFVVSIYALIQTKHAQSQIDKDRAAIQEATPEAKLVSIGNSPVVSSQHTYPVDRNTNIAFTFHKGATDLQPLIVVWSGDIDSSKKFYAIDPATVTPDNPRQCAPKADSNDEWICGGIKIGTDDPTTPTTDDYRLYVYGVPGVIMGAVQVVPHRVV